jgi:hypothetical protein
MLFKLRVDRSRGNIPHLRFGFRDKKKAVTHPVPFRPPLPKRKIKKARNNARKEKGKEKKKLTFILTYTPKD